MKKITSADISGMIDHSLLNPAMTAKDIREGCLVAKEYSTATVCVKPSFVEEAAAVLKGSEVKVTTVIGFPHGSNLTDVKGFESERALAQGCRELDMVLDIGRLLGGQYDYVENDIRAVAAAAHKKDALLKVILENAYLNEELIVRACKICEAAGADFVKTSTGYAPSGAKLSDLRIMRAAVSDKVRVKAAGGIRTLEAALMVMAVGATRFGCTATVSIMEEARKREASGTLLPLEDTGGELEERHSKTY